MQTPFHNWNHLFVQLCAGAHGHQECFPSPQVCFMELQNQRLKEFSRVHDLQSQANPAVQEFVCTASIRTVQALHLSTLCSKNSLILYLAESDSLVRAALLGAAHR